MLQTRHLEDDECSWSDIRGVNIIRKWMLMLRNMLAFVSYFLARTSALQQGALAAVVWQELYRHTQESLRADNILMRGYAADHGVPTFNAEDHTRSSSSPEPPDDQPTECVICMDARPSVVLIPCGHIFCGPCVEGMARCPSCRDMFESKYNIYF